MISKNPTEKFYRFMGTSKCVFGGTSGMDEQFYHDTRYYSLKDASKLKREQIMTPTNQAWLETIAHVLDHGHDLRQEDRAHAPRDATTKEIICHTVRVPMTEPVVTLLARKLNYRFMCAEAASILQGDNRAAVITPYAKQVIDFSDDGYSFAGHHGVKYVEQVSWVAATLAKDSASRQAVLNIWRERPGSSRDTPCTLSLQWLIRDGQIHCVSTMRSSDVWCLPYDLHAFSAMSMHLALILRRYHNREVELGWLHNTAGSRHLYRRDWEPALDCLDPQRSFWDITPLDLAQFAGPDDLVAHYWTLARGEQPRHGWLKDMFPRPTIGSEKPWRDPDRLDPFNPRPSVEPFSDDVNHPKAA